MRFVALTLVLAMTTRVCAEINTVPDAVAQHAQKWLDDSRVKDSVLEGTRLGSGYAVVSLPPRRTIEFMRSDSVLDPAELAGIPGTSFYFPILKGDSALGSMQVCCVASDRNDFLTQFEDDPYSLGVVVATTDRLLTENAHCVWVVDAMWPIACKTIIAEKPDGQRIAIELPYLENSVGDELLMKRAEPVKRWSDRFRAKLRTAYDIDRPTRSSRHEIPAAAREEAQLQCKHDMIYQQMKELSLSGSPALGTPWITYDLNPVEQLLYAESTEIDPAIFDADPTFNFPVVVDGTTVFTLWIRRAAPGCGAVGGDPNRLFQFMGGSGSLPFPSDLLKLGDIADLNVIDVSCWYHVVGPDTIWVAPYYVPKPGLVSHPEPIAKIAQSLKERIQARYPE